LLWKDLVFAWLLVQELYSQDSGNMCVVYVHARKGAKRTNVVNKCMINLLVYTIIRHQWA